MQKMEESQNFVLKDCHEKTQNMLKRLIELEKTDFNDKFNNITRRMIGDVVRDLLTPIQLGFNLDIKAVNKHVEEHASTMVQFQEAIRGFKDQLDDYGLRNIYNLQDNKKEGEAYMRELVRMQKLDHIRVQVSQKDRLQAVSNPWFNKTVDINHASALTLDNDPTQDSLYVNKEREQPGSAMRYNSLTKTPTQFHSIQPDELNIRDSNISIPWNSASVKNDCVRNLKPSQRNKVLMTRSVDHSGMQGSFMNSIDKQSSMLGSNVGMVTARMHLNKNTTLELMESNPINQSSRKQQLSPFTVKAQRQRMNEDRKEAIQAQILQQYSIEPFKSPQRTTMLDNNAADSRTNMY